MDHKLEAILTNRLYLKVKTSLVYYKSPSISLKNKASIIYQEALEDCLYEEWPTALSIRKMLIENGLVTPNVEANLKELDKNIEDAKLSLYRNVLNEKEQKKIRKNLNMLKEKKEEIEINLHRYDYLTAEGYAAFIKSQFILKHSIFRDKRQFLTDDIDFFTYELITDKINRLRPTYSELRSIARGDEWGTIWRASKGRPFRGESFNWTDEQRNLVLLSQMYDSVHKHPECPPDNVINDDDMLDGWLIFQRRKSERERKQKNLENTVEGLGKHQGDEQFIFVDNPEAAAAIEELNDGNALMKKRQRQSVINQMGEARDINFLDRRLEAQTQSNQAFKNTAKGR